MSARRGPWKHVRIGANGHGRRGSAGITMVEMLITIALVSMVLVPVLGWSALAFQSDVSIGTRNQESNGFGLLQTYFARDVAQARTAEKGGTDCNPVGGVDAGIGAGDGGTVVLSLLSRETPVSRTVYSVARSTEDLPSGTTPDSLWRRVCDNTSSVVSEYTEVLPAMKASPVVTCDDSPTSTKCETVKMKVFGPDDDVDDDMTVEAKRNLNVITDGGLTADKNPVAATGTMSPASSTLVTFTAEFNDTDTPAQSASSYLWDFGDGTDPVENGASVDLGGGVMGNEITHRFDPDTTDDDTYEVTVVAKTGSGTDSSEDTKTVKIVVDEYDPIAKLDLSPAPARKAQTVVADATGSTDGFDTTAATNPDQDASNSPDFDDTIDQYVIEFIDKTKYAADPADPDAIEASKTITRAADGTIDTDQTLSHTITTNGTKLARVTVTDQVGKTDSVTKVAVVDEDGDGFSPQPPAPAPQFPPNYADCDDADATRYPGAPDPLDGIDQDCNGRDGSDANTLYVKSSGSSDSNLCTFAQPCRQITRAVAVAQASVSGPAAEIKSQIAVSGGNYNNFKVQSANHELTIMGGFRPDFALNDTNTNETNVRGGMDGDAAFVVQVRNATADVALKAMSVRAMDVSTLTAADQRKANGDGKPTYGLQVLGSGSHLTLEDAQIFGGVAGGGATGANGSGYPAGSSAPGGWGGWNGFQTGKACDTYRTPGQQGGSGDGRAPGGKGGDGGQIDTDCRLFYLDYDATSGRDGADGGTSSVICETGDTARGVGGTGGPANANWWGGTAGDGKPGERGCHGRPGGGGAQGTAGPGTLSASYVWQPGSSAGDGTVGYRGSGGGGGGGGGGSDGGGWFGNIDDYGASGGGGGGGGLPAVSSGQRGGAGGASIAVLAVDSVVGGTRVDLIGGTGGAGGRGGAGALGQAGGVGGPGGNRWESGGAGGVGGAGGRGGSSGGGGGGAGGPSIAVARKSGTVSGVSVSNVGAGGSGGRGGTAASYGNAGQDGQANQFYDDRAM